VVVLPMGRGDAILISEEEEDSNDNDQDPPVDDDDSSSSCLSHTPPDTLPVVLVDVERLTGYSFSSNNNDDEESEELAALRRTVRTALWGEEVVEPATSASTSAANAATAGGETTEDEKKQVQPHSAELEQQQAKEEESVVLARDFEERVTDLFATGMARHGDSSMTNKNHQFVAVEYPEFLCQPCSENDDDGATGSAMVLPTARVWKRLSQPHAVPVVDRLLRQRLRACSRSLLWKHAMHAELRRLVRSEEAAVHRRRQRDELAVWKVQGRRAQLDRLYEVREVLQERVQQAVQQQNALEGQRERAVQKELQKRRLVPPSGGSGGVGTGTGGLEAFDFESTVFAFPDRKNGGPSLLLGLKEDDDEEEYQRFLEQQEGSDDDEGELQSEGGAFDENGNESEDALDATDDVAEECAGATSPNDVTRVSSASKKERRKAAARNHRQRLQESNKEAEHRAKLLAAQAEEEAVRERCTTQQLRIHMAVVNSLTAKLKQVDDLLESLQEEQWADEEAAEEEAESPQNSATRKIPAEPSDEPQLSLLDQVLAMILGASPPPEGTSLEDHVRFLEQEHTAILREWKEHFGRLPPPLLSSSSTLDTSTANQGWDTTKTTPAATTETAVGVNALPNSATPADMRQSLGIVENDGELWDSDGEEEGDDEAEIQQPSRPTERPVGLRPGGRLPPQ